MKDMSTELLEKFEFNQNRKSSNRELLISYKENKDTNTRNKLIENNIGLVYTIAKSKKKGFYSLSFEDLVQEGIIGMMKGVERFDIDRGTSFSTYICYWINHEINRAIINTGHLIRLPAHMYEKVYRVTQIENLNKMQNSDLDLESICEIVKITENEYNNIDYCRNSFYNLTSLNTNLNTDNDDPYVELQDFIPSNEPTLEEIVMNESLKENLESVLDTLTLREKEILKLRYGLEDNKPATLEEIGNRYGLTRERIRQIEIKALKKIERSRNGTYLKDYLSYP